MQTNKNYDNLEQSYLFSKMCIRDSLCCSPFSKRPLVSDLRQTNKQKEVGVKRVVLI